MTQISSVPMGTPTRVSGTAALPPAETVALRTVHLDGVAPADVSPLPVRRRRSAAPAHLVADVLVALVALAVAALTTSLTTSITTSITAVSGVLLVVAWVLVARVTRARLAPPVPVGDLRSSLRATAQTALVVGVGCFVATTVWPVLPSVPMLVFTAVALVVGCLPAGLAGRRRGPLRVALVGDAASVAAFAETDEPQVVVTGACLTGSDDELVPDLRTARGLHDLESVLGGAQAVLVLPGPDLPPRVVRRIGWQLEELGLPLVVAAGTTAVDPRRAHLTRRGNVDLMVVRPARLACWARVAKHAADRILAAAALLVLAPLLGVLALLVRCDSRGPAFFRQVRVGQDGFEFTMLKLRTMREGSEAQVTELRETHQVGHVLFKLPADPRVTRVGAVLRRYSLDELPQLVNVLRGEMSLVGPRPALPSEVLTYGEEPRRRLAVRPGLTGLWQVSGRSDLSWEESVRLDIDYVDNWTPAGDLAIIGRTVGAVLRPRGAY